MRGDQYGSVLMRGNQGGGGLNAGALHLACSGHVCRFDKPVELCRHIVPFVNDYALGFHVLIQVANQLRPNSHQVKRLKSVQNLKLFEFFEAFRRKTAQ